MGWGLYDLYDPNRWKDKRSGLGCPSASGKISREESRGRIVQFKKEHRLRMRRANKVYGGQQ